MSDEMQAAAAPEEGTGRARQQTKVGTVVSTAMNKTVTVSVPKTTVHPLYHRYIRRSSKFAAHDENNECQVGDQVMIVSCRPLSKRKRWRVRRIIQRAE